MSAPRPGALPSIFSLEPGTERQERRGRLRERSDMGEKRKAPVASPAVPNRAKLSPWTLGDVAAAIGVELVGRMAHGESGGAFDVRTADGTDAVLKLYTGDVLDLGAPAALVDALRARGYPAPATLRNGCVDGIRATRSTSCCRASRWSS